MRIYKIVFEVDKYISLLPKDQSIYDMDFWPLDGTSIINKWPNIVEAEIDNEDGEIPDIYDFGVGNMLFSEPTMKNVASILGSNIEYLPVKWENKNGYIANVVGYVDCLDNEKTDWYVDDESEKRLYIEKYAFIPEKIDKMMLFKIQENCFEIYTVDDIQGNSFISIIKKNNFEGLSFELVWEN